jgi:hypothetical protein
MDSESVPPVRSPNSLGSSRKLSIRFPYTLKPSHYKHPYVSNPKTNYELSSGVGVLSLKASTNASSDTTPSTAAAACIPMFRAPA